MKPSPAAQAAFDVIADTLGGEVVRKQMMGCPILMRAGGRMVVCLDADVLAFKLGRETPEHAVALAVPGAEVWSPKESHRNFSDWVGIPVAQSDQWLDWTRTAIDRHDEVQLRGGGRGR